MYFYHPSLKKKYLSISSALGLTHPTVCAVMDHSGGGVEGWEGRVLLLKSPWITAACFSMSPSSCSSQWDSRTKTLIPSLDGHFHIFRDKGRCGGQGPAQSRVIALTREGVYVSKLACDRFFPGALDSCACLSWFPSVVWCRGWAWGVIILDRMLGKPEATSPCLKPSLVRCHSLNFPVCRVKQCIDFMPNITCFVS